MGEEASATRVHLYGGQAVVEGVMMRGRDVWAIAVRRPTGDVHVESHDINSVMTRHPWLGRPGFRGVIALGQALSIGMKALRISAEQSSPEGERLSSRQMAFSMTLAVVLFVGIFIVLPAVAFAWVGRRLSSGLFVNIMEGIFRVAIFLAYLVLIGRTKEIRRVFQYHGAEHKTIAAYEHDEPLDPEHIDRYSTLHVRCGTNFLLIVMILTIVVFSVFGSPPLLWRVVSRIVIIPLIAAIAYELLRLGARFPDSSVVRAAMAPGLWLQRITTNQPDADQIEVAIASFREVLRREAAAAPGERPSEA